MAFFMAWLVDNLIKIKFQLLRYCNCLLIGSSGQPVPLVFESIRVILPQAIKMVGKLGIADR